MLVDLFVENLFIATLFFVFARYFEFAELAQHEGVHVDDLVVVVFAAGTLVVLVVDPGISDALLAEVGVAL